MLTINTNYYYYIYTIKFKHSFDLPIRDSTKYMWLFRATKLYINESPSINVSVYSTYFHFIVTFTEITHSWTFKNAYQYTHPLVIWLSNSTLFTNSKQRHTYLYVYMHCSCNADTAHVHQYCCMLFGYVLSQSE